MPINGQYNFAEAVEELKLRFGRRNDNFYPQRIARFLDSAQFKIAKSWIEVPDLEDTIPAMPIVGGVSEYDLRTTAPPVINALGIERVKHNTTGYMLRRFPFFEYMELVNQAQGVPVRWTRRGYLLVLDPKPLEAATIKIMFRRRPEFGVIELDSDWQEDLLKVAEFIGWSAIGEHEKANAVMSHLPAQLQMLIARPMDQGDFEAIYDPDYGIHGPAWANYGG